MWGETFERDVIFSLWWLVGELEALVLSCIEDTALLGLGQLGYPGAKDGSAMASPCFVRGCLNIIKSHSLPSLEYIALAMGRRYLELKGSVTFGNEIPLKKDSLENKNSPLRE